MYCRNTGHWECSGLVCVLKQSTCYLWQSEPRTWQNLDNREAVRGNSIWVMFCLSVGWLITYNPNGRVLSISWAAGFIFWGLRFNSIWCGVTWWWQDFCSLHVAGKLCRAESEGDQEWPAGHGVNAGVFCTSHCYWKGWLNWLMVFGCFGIKACVQNIHAASFSGAEGISDSN